MWELIIGLAVAGLLLIGIELFVPGMVLGALGAAALVASVAISFATQGFAAGCATLVALMVLSSVGAMVWLRIFPRTAIGKKLTLESSLSGPNEHPDFSGYVGKQGVALTILRPSGTALIEGKRIDVISDGEFLEAGTELSVAAVEGARVLVRKR